MAITPDWLTKTFFIPQADLDLVTGTLYDVRTETYFRAGINAIMASEEGIVFDDPIDHNTTYTVAGITYARKVEVINGYNVTFTPDAQWSARLQESNNNLFDIENGILNQNQVQVIPNNSAGLIVISTGSGLDASQDTKLTEAHAELTNIEGSQGLAYWVRVMVAALAGKLTGAATTTVSIQDQAKSKNRIVATTDADGNRDPTSIDGT